ncbi:MAG: sigma 54-interacting transcriptional regulator [Peptococcaceae bacterium]|nr:sigma 54-interacting transcriptional regulator [Peptococcaceae bacterium]
MNLLDLVERARTIFDSVYNGMVIADEKGRVVFVNKANERITGITAGQAVGRLVTDVVPGTMLLHVLQSGRELTGIQTTVGDKAVISNIMPIRDGGRVIGAISVFQDLTEMMNLADSLAEAENTIEHLSRKLSRIQDCPDPPFIGKNPEMQRVYQLAAKTAGVDSTVLICGESGTGKEVLARFIHSRSPRAARPFIAVNSAAIPENLMESELFGYDEGAFTGARRGGRKGYFELAEGGTLFLDEIAETAPALQAKLLRVLQTREIIRVGGTRWQKADVRIIAATNRDLARAIDEKLFRADLYYRLSVVNLHLPPLRNRLEDLPALAETLLERIARRLKKDAPSLSPEALEALMNYHFPGNVRELENILEQGTVMAEKGRIEARDLPAYVTGRTGSEPAEGLTLNFSHFPTMAGIEREVISQARRKFATRKEICAALKISRATLYRKLRRHGMA